MVYYLVINFGGSVFGVFCGLILKEGIAPMLFCIVFKEYKYLR